MTKERTTVHKEWLLHRGFLKSDWTGPKFSRPCGTRFMGIHFWSLGLIFGARWASAAAKALISVKRDAKRRSGESESSRRRDKPVRVGEH
jgi:hypothetical protein